MNRTEGALGGFGVLATLFGVGLLVAPGLVHAGPVERLTAGIAAAEPTTLMLALGGAAVLLVAVAAWPRSTAPVGEGSRAFDERVGRWADPDGPAASVLLGAEVETAIREGGEPWRRLRSALAETALDTYARERGVPPADAAAAIGRGTWTDDNLAASVTADERDPSPSARLLLWLTPERERRRRIERTVTAIETLQQR